MRYRLWDDRTSHDLAFADGGVVMRLPRRPAAAIFDMDGVLFDAERLYQEAIIPAAKEGGHEIPTDMFSRTVGLPWAQTRSLLLGHFGATFPVDEFEAAWIRQFWIIAETRLTIMPPIGRTSSRNLPSEPTPS